MFSLLLAAPRALCGWCFGDTGTWAHSALTRGVSAGTTEGVAATDKGTVRGTGAVCARGCPAGTA